MSMPPEDKVTYFAETDARNRRVKFGIKAKDRTRHMYVIGKTGMGKSTLLENMAVQDIQNGNGFAFMDPHGKTAELLLDYIPDHRKQDVLYFAPFDMEYPVSFNIMEDVGPDKRHLVLSGLMSTFKKIWVDAWSARMEYILSNTILALLEYPDATLLSVNRMYTDKDFRKKVVDNVKDVSVKSFWVDEYAKYTDRFTQEATPAIQNKVGQFTSNPVIRNIIGQPKSTFDLRKMMDEKKIIIVNLSKGRVGEVNANLLGSMFITKIYLAAMSRADVSDEVLSGLPNFYLYVDEFQSFANESFADILSEARKYKLNLTIAHQYIEQMSEEVRAAVFGNVGTMVTFRVGATDAEAFEKEFAPQFTAEDIVNLDKFQLYLRLMIDGVGSVPFSATSLPPIPLPESSSRQGVIDMSRKQFASPRTEVEKHILGGLSDAPTHELVVPKPPSANKGGQEQRKNNEQRAPQQRKQNPVSNKEEAKPNVSLGAAIQEALLVQSKTLEKKKEDVKQEVKEKRPSHAPETDTSDGFTPLSADILKTKPVQVEKKIEEKSVKATDSAEKKPEAPKQIKTATKEHLSDLRSALSGVLKQQKEQKPDVAHTTPEEKNVEKKESVPTEKTEEKLVIPTPLEIPKPPSVGQGAREVPKNVLEQVLTLDEEK